MRKILDVTVSIYYQSITDTVKDIQDLQNLLVSFNHTNKLFIIDFLGRFKDDFINNKNYLYVPLPENYVWHRPSHYISERGFSFMSDIGLKIICFIKQNFELINVEVYNPVELTKKYDKYNLFLQKELYNECKNLKLEIKNQKQLNYNVDKINTIVEKVKSDNEELKIVIEGYKDENIKLKLKICKLNKKIKRIKNHYSYLLGRCIVESFNSKSILKIIRLPLSIFFICRRKYHR